MLSNVFFVILASIAIAVEVFGCKIRNNFLSLFFF